MLVSSEIQTRRDDGRIASGNLPVHIQAVRLVMGEGGRVEINDEVQLEIEIKSSRPVADGELITLAERRFS